MEKQGTHPVYKDVVKNGLPNSLGQVGISMLVVGRKVVKTVKDLPLYLMEEVLGILENVSLAVEMVKEQRLYLVE